MDHPVDPNEPAKITQAAVPDEFRTLITVCYRIAFLLWVTSSACFMLVLTWGWGYAYANGKIPKAADWRPGRGPWDHDHEMHVFVGWIILSALLMMATGGVTALFCRRVRDWILFIVCVVVGFVALSYHFMLVD